MRTRSLLLTTLAFAAPALAGGTDGSGLVVLDPSASGALSMTGNSSVQIPARAVYVNSTASDAVRTVGTAVLDAPSLYLCGGASFGGHSECTGTTIHSNAPYADPMSGFRMPNGSGMTDMGALSVSGGTRTINPGFYSHGIQINSNAQVTMNPGVYVVSHGFRANSCRLVGSGICIVMLDGSLDLAGQAGLVLSPPDSGDMANVVICQPSSNTSGLSLAGGAEVNIAGAIYAPGATASLSGNSALQGQGPQMGDLVIANRVSLTGTSLIKIGHPEMRAIVLPSQPLSD
jgi:hypothetical protein